MTRSSVLVLGSLVMLSSASVAAPRDRYSFTGQFVFSESIVDPLTGNYRSLYVAQSAENSPQARTTYLSIYKKVCDEIACTEFTGYGLIPNDHFSSSPAHAQLLTTIAPSEDFQMNASRFDFDTMTYTDIAPPTGDIAVTWRRSGTFTETQSGTFTRTDENYMFRQTGHSTKNSAVASGLVLGAPVASKSEMGTGSSMSISISRMHP